MAVSELIMSILVSYGSWVSPITSDLIAKDALVFSEMHADDKDLYWTEQHSAEGGRLALMKRTAKGGIEEVFPEASVRTRVHEYGGGAFTVHNGTLYFTNDKDRKFYRYQDKKLKALGGSDAYRFADAAVRPDGKSIVVVCERHDSPTQVANFLSFIDVNGKERIIAKDGDFYSNPCFSPDGKKLAFLTWNFPNMPWDGTTLWVGNIDDNGEISNLEVIAGGKDESICQVQWAPDGTLYFVSDRTGFWNIYRKKGKEIEAVCPKEAEFGIPAWVFGRPTYAFLDDKIICCYTEKGFDKLGIIDLKTKQLRDLGLPFTAIANLIVLKDRAYFFGSTPTEPSSIISLDPITGKYEVIRKAIQISIDQDLISKPELIEYPSMGGKTGYGIYYAPKNPKYAAPQGEKPPLIVRCHGGPTSRASPVFSLEVQYWTSRGFAFVDINYGGSTGFGREYFKRLEGTWGVLDVEDSLSAVKTLIARGLVDEKRVVIRGGSAGGYTVLVALTQSNVFAAGTSYFGISDLELLYQDGHKFESRYTDRLVAPYPEGIELIHERSPIYHIDKIHAPILLLQGDEDKIVPPNQSEKIYEALKARGLPVEYILFKGEGHGFRGADAIKRSLDAELAFYRKVLSLK